MIDFFNALSDLLGSDLVQGNKAVIIVSVIFIVVVDTFLTWMFCTKIYLKLQLDKAECYKNKSTELQAKVDELTLKNKDLTDKIEKYSFERALDGQHATAFDDSAIDKFKQHL